MKNIAPILINVRIQKAPKLINVRIQKAPRLMMLYKTSGSSYPICQKSDSELHELVFRIKYLSPVIDLGSSVMTLKLELIHAFFQRSMTTNKKQYLCAISL